jgi:hypothetical protein
MNLPLRSLSPLSLSLSLSLSLKSECLLTQIVIDPDQKVLFTLDFNPGTGAIHERFLLIYYKVHELGSYFEQLPYALTVSN